MSDSFECSKFICRDFVEILHMNYKFLITDRPTPENIYSYAEELKKQNCLEVVRVCESTYNDSILENEGIHVTDLTYEDGSFPPEHIVDSWFELIQNRYSKMPAACVAVHCVLGLGRAPVLVAIALIELGMEYEEAVHLIRKRRRGVFNAKQLDYLKEYKPNCRLKSKKE